MTTTDSSLEERVSRLEGAYEHLATKDDLTAQVGSLQVQIAQLEAKMEQRFANQTRWFVGFMLSGMAFMSVVAFGVARLIE